MDRGGRRAATGTTEALLEEVVVSAGEVPEARPEVAPVQKPCCGPLRELDAHLSRAERGVVVWACQIRSPSEILDCSHEGRRREAQQGGQSPGSLRFAIPFC